MTTLRSGPESIDRYIAAFPPDVRLILERIRSTIRHAAPAADESISYKMPTFRLNGVLAHFAAFKNHIGFYPPVRGDAKLEEASSAFSSEKGNLRFPLDQPIPYQLVEDVVRFREKRNLSKAGAGRSKARQGAPDHARKT